MCQIHFNHSSTPSPRRRARSCNRSAWRSQSRRFTICWTTGIESRVLPVGAAAPAFTLPDALTGKLGPFGGSACAGTCDRQLLPRPLVPLLRDGAGGVAGGYRAGSRARCSAGRDLSTVAATERLHSAAALADLSCAVRRGLSRRRDVRHRVHGAEADAASICVRS